MENSSIFPIKNEKGLRVSALNPKYLHTNSTSHTWPFSAIAELIDNAYDPDVSASQLWIDLKLYKSQMALTFTDNGNGMNMTSLYKMLSFGFCEKVAIKGHMPVGHYGNGFKSGSMRLGKDALVFTRQGDCCSIGFLSQSFLTATNAETIIVPIVKWDLETNSCIKEEGSDDSMKSIFESSVIKDNESIKEEFNAIPGSNGTRIVVFNLRKAGDLGTEFDFTSDTKDIRIPSDDESSAASSFKKEQRQQHIPASDYSLRAYCSILYLKPKMQIILRGQKVKTCVIAKSLSKTEIDTYRPTGATKPVKIVFGFSQNKDHYGIMMYHRNRLIKPYIRVGYQLKANNLGVGVIGVIECDYLQPTHNKQDFDYTESYRTCMASLGIKLNEYWQEKRQAGKSKASASIANVEESAVENVSVTAIDEDTAVVPDELWVQCDNPQCLKWRKMPPLSDANKLPDKWFCSQHPLEEWQSCSVAEEPYWADDSDSVKPYIKEVKRKLAKEREQKKKASVKEKDAEISGDKVKIKTDSTLQAAKAGARDRSAATISLVSSDITPKKVQSVHPLATNRINTPPSTGPVFMHMKSNGSQLLSSALASNAIKMGKPLDIKTQSGKSAKLLYIASPQQLNATNSSGVTLKRLLNIGGKHVLYTPSSSTISNIPSPSATLAIPTASTPTVGTGARPPSSIAPSPSNSSITSQGSPIYIVNASGGTSKLAILSPVIAGGRGIPASHLSTPPVAVVSAQNISRFIDTKNILSPLQSTSPISVGGTPLPIFSGAGQAISSSDQKVRLVGLPGHPSIAEVSSKLTTSASPKTLISATQSAALQVESTASSSPSRRDDATSEPIKRRSSSNPLRRSKRSKGNSPSPNARPDTNGDMHDDDNEQDDAKPKVNSYGSNHDSNFEKLRKRNQQLRDLRKSVCSLLAILVPDLTLPDLDNRSLDDDTLDVLLKQVLDANAEESGK